MEKKTPDPRSRIDVHLLKAPSIENMGCQLNARHGEPENGEHEPIPSLWMANACWMASNIVLASRVTHPTAFPKSRFGIVRVSGG